MTARAFYSAVAAAASTEDTKISAKQVKAFCVAVKNVVTLEFQKGVASIAVPSVCRFRIRKLAARAPGQKIVFGKQVQIQAREASRVLKASPAKTLKDRFAAIP